ncbi:MAG: Protein of unknown function (DUF1049) [Rhodobacteraceae bacterium HLUCCA08]|nr:MAG: Protein of unknown function (DUF1049) [Rhodobacteraceae bacterium HLUCCA08]
MTYIRYAFWAIVAICLIFIGMANLEPTTLSLVPAGLERFVPFPTSIQVPLFVVIFAGVAIGLLVGFLWEWVREHRIRSEARARKREADALRREVDRLTAQKHEGKDEVLAILDKAS